MGSRERESGGRVVRKVEEKSEEQTLACLYGITGYVTQHQTILVLMVLSNPISF